MIEKRAEERKRMMQIVIVRDVGMLPHSGVGLLQTGLGVFGLGWFIYIIWHFDVVDAIFKSCPNKS